MQLKTWHAYLVFFGQLSFFNSKYYVLSVILLTSKQPHIFLQLRHQRKDETEGMKRISNETERMKLNEIYLCWNETEVI